METGFAKGFGSRNREPASTQLSSRLSMYRQSPLTTSHTRILTLYPARSYSVPLNSSLELMSITGNILQPYLSLSYVWGDLSKPEEITTNGVTLAITANLASALRQNRASSGESRIWIDALCINQSDAQERSRQVLLMKEIYSRADMVIGWLGPDDDYGESALNLLRNILEMIPRYHDHSGWLEHIEELQGATVKSFRQNGTEYAANASLNQLHSLLNRPFWNRVWIVQELVLPLKLKLVCGDASLDFPAPDDFRKAFKAIFDIRLSHPKCWTGDVWMQYRTLPLSALGKIVMLRFDWHTDRKKQSIRHEYFDGITGLLTTQNLLCNHQSTDPRDRIFGLLGLVNIDILSDYSDNVTAADVFIEVAQIAVQARNSNILSHAGIQILGRGGSSSNRLHMPSWVPVWTVDNRPSAGGFAYPGCHAFLSHKGFGMELFGRSSLRGSAVLCDTVSIVESQSGVKLREWDLAKQVDFNNLDHLSYPSGILRFEAFVLLMLSGVDPLTTETLQLGTEAFHTYSLAFFVRMFWQLTNSHRDEPNSPLSKYRCWHPANLENASLFQVLFGRKFSTSVDDKVTHTYFAARRDTLSKRSCFQTRKGYIGIGFPSLQDGDMVCTLEGHKSPVILRRVESHFVFLSDCEVVGIMNGEILGAVERNEARIEEIEIQ